MPRRKYTREFKVSAVKLVNEQGYSISEAGRSLGVDPNSVRGWEQVRVLVTRCPWSDLQGPHSGGHGRPLAAFSSPTRPVAAVEPVPTSLGSGF